MSLKVMDRVWQHSEASAEALLVLLAIADFADDNGHAYPGVETLARKARCSVRGVQGILRKLEADLKELRIQVGAGPRGTNRYWVVTGTPAAGAGGKDDATPAPDAPPHAVHPAGKRRPTAGGTPAADSIDPRTARAPDPSGDPSDRTNRQDPSFTTTATFARDESPAIEAASELLGKLTRATLRLVQQAVADYSDEWVRAAIDEAAAAGQPRWNYARAILERWDRDGFRTTKREALIARARQNVAARSTSAADTSAPATDQAPVATGLNIVPESRLQERREAKRRGAPPLAQLGFEDLSATC